MSTRLSLGKSTPAIRAIVPPLYQLNQNRDRSASSCDRHHPLQPDKQRIPGTPSASFAQGGGRLGWPSLRASTEHSIRLGPEPINPECAVREHNGQPCRPAPLSCVRDARAREATCPPSPARPFRAPPTRSRTPENYRLLSPYRALAYRS